MKIEHGENDRFNEPDPDKPTRILCNVTEFADILGYCEWKLPYHMKGMRPKKNAATIYGSAIHDNLEAYEKKTKKLKPVTPELIIDKNKDIEFYREEIFTRATVDIDTKDHGNYQVILNGRADKLKREGSTLIVEDDKSVKDPSKYDNLRKPYKGQMLQVLTYLNSQFSTDRDLHTRTWFDIPHDKAVWRLNIRPRNEPSEKPYKVFEGEMTSDVNNGWLIMVSRFVDIVSGRQEPDHHGSANKCRYCGFFDYCKMRVTE